MAIPAPFVVSRVFRAPPQRLFEVFTQPQHLARWLSPEGFRTIRADMDFRVGGQYHYGIEAPNGMQMWGKQTYREITPHQKLVHLQSFSDPAGGLGVHPMSPTWPKYLHVTTTFEGVPDDGTRVTLTWVPYESDDLGHQTFDSARAGIEAGWAGTLAKLESYLESLED